MMCSLTQTLRPEDSDGETINVELTQENAETLVQYAAQWGCSPEQALLIIIMEAACQPSVLTDG